MADNTALFISLDAQSQGAIAPYTASIDTSGLQSQLLSLYQQVQNTFPWAPPNLVSIASQVLSAGGWPRLRSFPPGQARPSWLADDSHYNQWRQMITGPYKALDTAFLSQNYAAVSAAAAQAAANADFWNTVAKYSGVDLLEGVWQDLQNALNTIRAQREAALVSLNTAKQIIGQYQGRAPSDLTTQTASLAANLAALDNKARSVLAPIPTAAQEAGLSGAPLIVAGIAAATVTAVAASAWAVAAEFTSIQKSAAANAQALIQWRDAQDAQDFAAGRITNDQLMARRADSVKASNTVVNAQGAAAVGRAIGDAGRGIGSGVALAVGGLTFIGLAALLIIRFARPSKSAR